MVDSRAALKFRLRLNSKNAGFGQLRLRNNVCHMKIENWKVFPVPGVSVYERGDSVALAVQSGTVHFPASPAFSSSLQQLVIRMLNLEWGFR